MVKYFFTVLVLALFPAEGWSATYVIGAGGDYVSFAAINWGAVSPGDTITTNGKFIDEALSVGKAGAAGSPVRINVHAKSISSSYAYVTFEGCVVSGAADVGITITGTNNRVLGCTIANTASHGVTHSVNVEVRDTAFYGIGGSDINSTGGAALVSNNWMTASGNPLFLSPATRDFRLAGNSPLRGAGNAGLPRKRLDGRYFTEKPDIGAYQSSPGCINPTTLVASYSPGAAVKGYPSVIGVGYTPGTDTYRRIGDIASQATGTTPGNAVLPVQAGMRRCTLLDNGTVNYYLCPTNSAQKANCVDSATLTGADGSVMVEIPKFYYKYQWDGNEHQWLISAEQLPGYDLHPAFIKDGTPKDYRYVGAYEAALYSNYAARHVPGCSVHATGSGAGLVFSAAGKSITKGTTTNPFSMLRSGDPMYVLGSTYNDGTYDVNAKFDNYFTVVGSLTGEVKLTGVFVGTLRDWDNDKLSSVAGIAPHGMLHRDKSRQLAKRRGSGWGLMDFYTYHAIQLLYLTEYATFNSQAAIGNGSSDWDDTSWENYNQKNPINLTGLSNPTGNGTAANSAGNLATGSYMTYRGLENIYGGLWDWIDGINVDPELNVWVSNNSAIYADDTSSGYQNIGSANVADNYIATIAPLPYGFLPATTAASEDKIHDYFYKNNSSVWSVARVGGSAKHGVQAGFFHLAFGSQVTHTEEYYGTRIEY